jgi:hypothetical protein
MDPDRGSARAFDIAVNAKHIADVYRLVKAHGFNCNGRDTAPSALAGANAGRNIHLRENPASEYIATWIGVRRHGNGSRHQIAAWPFRFALHTSIFRLKKRIEALTSIVRLKLSKLIPGKRITPHFVVESLLGYAKTLAYGENVAMMPAQGLNDQTSFEIADNVLQRSVRAFIGCIGIKPSAQQTQDETIRDIPEFANISGPIERHQIAHQLICYNGRFAFVASRAKQDVMLEQLWNILAPFPKRRNGKGHHIESEVEIASEPPHIARRFQIQLRRRDNTNRDVDQLVGAETFKLTELQDAQQFDLQCHGHGFDFIKE